MKSNSDPRRSRRRRDEILGAAVDLASADGIEGLSIGRLADAIGMSKSGLFAHFGSKEDLQIATLRTAAAAFQQRVLDAHADTEPGLARLTGMIEAWLGYVEQIEYRGGCFFAAASGELSGQRGPVPDLLRDMTGTWLRGIEREVRTARRLGELAPDVDAALLAFQLHAYVQEANWARETLRDAHAFGTARRAVAAALAVAQPSSARRRR